MRQTARQRVLQYVRRHPGVTAAQIGFDIQMSAATVRHHMAILLSDERVVTTGHRVGKGPGRPRHVYQVPDRSVGDNLAMVADSLLAASLDNRVMSTGDAVESLTHALTIQIGPIGHESSMGRRISALVARLTHLHYLARWEAGGRGPRLVFGHCPYAAIVGRHPELCRMDALALERLTGMTAQQLARIDPSASSPSSCVFVLSSTIPPGI